MGSVIPTILRCPLVHKLSLSQVIDRSVNGILRMASGNGDSNNFPLVMSVTGCINT